MTTDNSRPNGSSQPKQIEICGEPFGIRWGTDTGERVETSEVRYFRSYDSLYRMYVTGPGGSEPIREVWRDGRLVAFANRDEMEAAAKRIAFAGGYLLDTCPFCGTHKGLHMSSCDEGGVFVQCATCGGCGPMLDFDALGGAEQRVADLWNARTLPRLEHINDFRKEQESGSKNKGMIGVFQLEPNGMVTLLREIEK